MSNQIPEELKNAILNNKLILFIGAGCSLSFGLPTWKDLILKVLNKLEEKHGDSDSLTSFKSIKNNVFSNRMNLFEALNEIELRIPTKEQYKSETKQIIYELIDSIDITKNNSEEHSLFWEISTKIITTNYDRIIEKFIPENANIKVFDNKNNFQSGESLKEDSEFLYHIHGDYQNPSTIILFESDYQNIYNNSNHNYKTLETFFKGKTLLFIGFSLSDPFVTDLFDNIKNIYGGYKLNDHFAFTIKNDDFTKYDVQSIQIENWDDSLKDYLLKLSLMKKGLPTIIPKREELIKEEKVEDLNTLKKLIDKKSDELKKNPNDSKLLTEIHDLKAKIEKQLFGDIDYLQKVDINYKKTEVRSLFDSVYSLENYDRNIIDRINKIRNNHDEYNWYDRSVILSGITCSLIHFKKADNVKISLIIDFINDNEDKVWQKAITSLFIVLNHLGNKWLRFSQIKKKLELLKQIPQIQEACLNIIQLFNMGYYKISFLDGDIFKNEYFKETPFNYFLPFFVDDKNEGFLALYENFDGDVDEFIKFIKDVPLPDQIKYLLCNSKSNKSDKEKTTKEEKKELNSILALNFFFYPYTSYIHEIINFYRFFPKLDHEEKLNYQLEITENKIINYLLNEVEKSKALGLYFMREKNWSQAIVNFKKANELSKDDIEVLSLLADCYNFNKDDSNELKIRDQIFSIDNKNEDNLISMVYMHEEKKNYNKCLSIIELLLKEYPKKGAHYNLRCHIYVLIEDFEKALSDVNKAIHLDPKNNEYYLNRAVVFRKVKKYNEALADNNKSIEIDSNYKKNYEGRAISLFYLRKYNDALIDVNKAIELDAKSVSNYQLRSIIYLKLRLYDKSIADNDYCIKSDSKYAGFHDARASIYLNMRKYDDSLRCVNKAIEINDNDADFYLTRSNIYLILNKLDLAYLDILKAQELRIQDKDDLFIAYINYYRLKKDSAKGFEYLNLINYNHEVYYFALKATLFSSINDDFRFFENLELAFEKGLIIDELFEDVIDKYKKNTVFLALLNKYNQNYL